MSNVEIDAEAEKLVKEIGIPPCPKIVLEFMQEMRKDSPDARRLLALIGSDPGLSAAVLKTANSSFYGLRTKVATVQQGLTILGMRATAMLVTGLLLRRAFPVARSKLMVDLWSASAVTAATAAALAPAFGSIDRHLAYTYGLFRDCGQAVLLFKYPNYQQLFLAADSEGTTSTIDAEERSYRVHHARVGAILAHSWELPDTIYRAIFFHHDHARVLSGKAVMTQASSRMIALGILADQLQSLRKSTTPHREWATGKEIVARELGVDVTDEVSLLERFGLPDVDLVV